MQQVTSGNININVTEAQTIGVPDTGFNLVSSYLGGTGYAVIISALIMIVATIVFGFLRKRLRKWRFFGVVFFALVTIVSTLSVSAAVIAVKALQDAASTVVLDVTLENGEEPTTETVDFVVNLGSIDRAYMVYAYMEGSNNLVNIDDSSAKITPTAATTSGDPDSLSLNSYGIKLSDGGNFMPLSADPNAPTLLYVSDTATNDTTLNLTYGVKLSADLPGGTYINVDPTSRIKYIVEPQHQFTLTYDTAGAPENMPTTDVYGPATVFGYTFTIPNDAENVPTRTGYTFAGWCDGVLTATDACDGTSYQPGSEVAILVHPATEIDATTTLHAMWAPQTHTITYKSYDGGTTYGTQDFVYDAATNMLAHNAATGWTVTPEAPADKTFAGWTTTQGSTTPTYTDGQSINNLTSDTTVYAIWKQDLVLNFYQGDGTNDKVEKTIYNASTSTLYNPPVVDNRDATYSAAGWGATNTATTAEIAQTAVFKTLTQSDNNKSYYAMYEYDISTSYKPNGGSGLMIGGFCVAHSVAKGGNESGYNTVGCDITLPNSGFTYTGNAFDKWAEGSTTGTQYAAGAVRNLTTNTDFYAIWEALPTTFADAYAAAGKSKLGSHYKMQDMTSAICSAVTTATTTGKEQTEVLIDSRDNKLYYVSKLRDGKCWMTQNLDLDITTSGFTNADTDLNSQTAWNSTTYLADPNTPGAINSPAATRTTSSSTSIYTDNLSWDLGNYAHDGTTVASCGTTATSYNGCNGFSATDATTSKANHYHVGNLYKFNTATAGSGVTITETGKQAPDSICPKGWRLPTGGSTGEFSTLATTYSVGANPQTLVNSPFYMTRAGQVNNSSKLALAGQNGVYYSSTVKYSATDRSAYALSVAKTSITLDFANKQYMGWAVRCVAR